MALFESYERREKQILAKLAEYGINSIEEAAEVTKAAGLDVYKMVEGIQPICFENAKWAYTVGAAIAIKKGCTKAADAAAAIGEGLQSFCIPGSVADQRKVGLGHGNLGKMLLEEDTECFAFLAGHESFAAAEGAIGIAEKANKVRKKPLRVILNGLGKDAAQIIARINGFTYVETELDYHTGELKEVFRKSYSEGLRAKVNCYGANDVVEGVKIMDEYYDKYVTCPDDAQYRLDWIEDYFTPDMHTEYVYPNVFMNREDTEELSNLQADIQKTINAKKSDWIMNGFTDADWDEYLKSLDSYGLEDYLKIYQKYLDAYYAEQK